MRKTIVTIIVLLSAGAYATMAPTHTAPNCPSIEAAFARCLEGEPIIVKGQPYHCKEKS